MKFIDKLKKFFKGTLDYENPSAGCCKGSSAIPDIQEGYKKVNKNRNKETEN